MWNQLLIGSVNFPLTHHVRLLVSWMLVFWCVHWSVVGLSLFPKRVGSYTFMLLSEHLLAKGAEVYLKRHKINKVKQRKHFQHSCFPVLFSFYHRHYCGLAIDNLDSFCTMFAGRYMFHWAPFRTDNDDKSMKYIINVGYGSFVHHLLAENEPKIR